MADSVQKKLQELGGLRFKSGAEFEKEIQSKVTPSVARMLGNLADNYPNVPVTKIARMYSAFCEEREKALSSMMQIAEDQFYVKTRPEFLFQILGDLLFIEEKVGSLEYTDASYRDFLIKVKRAYFGGSTLANINKSLSSILGVPVAVREMYLDARRVGAYTSIKDTHRMIANILMGDENTTLVGTEVSLYIRDLYYFIDLIRPSHSLFETDLMWKEGYSLLGCQSDDIAQDENGNSYVYELTELPNDIYSLYRLFIGTEEQSTGFISSDWVEGVIEFIDLDVGVITLQGNTELVLSDLSVFYKYQEDGTHRVEWVDAAVGDHLYFLGNKAKGSFNFHEGATPKAILNNYYAQYNPLVIASSAFQANVIRERALSGRSQQVKACTENLMDDTQGTALLPLYEDMRDNCDYPSPQPYAEKVVIPEGYYVEGGETFINLSATLSISEDGNYLKITNVPLVNTDGNLATKDDIVVYIDGRKIVGAVKGVDPWEGLIELNFVPITGTTLQLNYYFQNVYPKLIKVGGSGDFVSGGVGNDLPAQVNISEEGSPIVKFQWPFRPVNYDLYGNSMSYQMNQYPILNRNGDLAQSEDVTVYLNGVELPGSVVFVRALLGHIQINFIPPVGSSLEFEYYYQSQKRTYGFILDSDQHLLDTVYGSESPYTLELDPEPFLGLYNNLDQFRKPAEYSYRYRAFDSSQTSVVSGKDTGKLNQYSRPGVRGSFQDSGSKTNQFKVVFSGEYLTDTDKYVELNDQYLENGLPALTVLRKGIPPFYRSFTSVARHVFSELVVDPGAVDTSAGFNLPASISVDNLPGGVVEFIPIDDYFNHNRIKIYTGLKESVAVDGYEDIDLNSICEDRNMALQFGVEEEYYPNRELRLNDYKDYLLRRENPTTFGRITAINGEVSVLEGVNNNFMEYAVGSVMHLSAGGVDYSYTITDIVSKKDSTTNKAVAFLDRAFEGPSGSYDITLDLPVYGSLYAIKGSDVVKSATPSVDWVNCRVGSIISVTSTVNGTPRTVEFTIVETINRTTAKLDRPFVFSTATSKVFEFTLRFPYIQKADVLLNEVVRRKRIDINELKPGYAPVGTVFIETRFKDPDPDPYPRNRSNFNFPTPTPPLLTSEIHNGPGGEGESGERDLLLEEAVADKMVKFRNWDQDMIVMTPGTYMDAFEEPMDDLSDGSLMYFWSLAESRVVTFSFRGTVLITKESLGSVPISQYPNGLIQVESEVDTTEVFDPIMNLKRTEVRQILPDNSIELVSFYELVRIIS